MKTLRTTIVVLVALVALLAVACGDSEEAVVVEPTPEPTVAPTPIPPTATPVPPTPEPLATEPAAAPDTTTGTDVAQAGTEVMTFDVPDFGPETTGQDIAEALLSPEEIGCIMNTLGPEASQALLAANVLDPAAQGSTTVFGECLTQENAVTLFLAGFKGATGGALSEDSLNCIGNVAAPHYKTLFAVELDPAVMFGLIPCLSPEEMTALQTLMPQ